MKRIFPVILSLGMLLILFSLFHSAGGASGAAQSPSIGGEEQNEIEQTGPPWFDEAWHYRRPISINSSIAIPWYQVLIKLNNINFSFDLANPNGSDIRFTHSDGTTELDYWIESWDSSSKSAYIWVKVPSLADGDTTIYIYYNNLTAPFESNGSKTFDSFDDDWSYYSSGSINNFDREQKDQSIEEILSLFSWETISGSPTVSSGILSLNSGSGIKSKSSNYLYQAVGFRANYGLGNGYEWAGFISGSSGPRTIIGDLPSDHDGTYLMNYLGDNTTQMGSNNWHDAFHIYEVRWSNGKSFGSVDHGNPYVNTSTQVPITSLPVTLYSYYDSNAVLQVDWVYVRQYHDPEPTASVGAEQGLVELGISMSDSPDPLPKGEELIYDLTVSNTSSIAAPGVVVTDTLPNEVAFVGANAPHGCNHVDRTVICDLNAIAANSSASATIVVVPAADGIITNSASVGSPGYELDLSDNCHEITTLVDSVPPTVEWIEPTTDGNIYFTPGGWITLRASAEDTSGISNSGVAYVEFWRYIPDPLKIATVDLSPYQIQFNSDNLVPNQPWPFEVFAFDRAGNRSAVEPPGLRQVIYIERIFRYLQYLPFIKR
jgi:uncharacterized repeat protein (TIGR01451 family)